MIKIFFEGDINMKSKFLYDDFLHDLISELEKIRLMFSSFNPFVPSLPKQQTTANSFSVVTKLNHNLCAYR